MFDELRNWTLMTGSHPFPGAGTCIIEALIVASGEPYREVGDSGDFPEHLCPSLGSFALALNDTLRDDLRQELKRFVGPLAHTKDTSEVMARRVYYIVGRAHDLAHRYSSVDAMAFLAAASCHSSRDEDPAAAHHAGKFLGYNASCDSRLLPLVLDILEGALKIGKRGGLDADVANGNLRRVKKPPARSVEERGVITKASDIVPHDFAAHLVVGLDGKLHDHWPGVSVLPLIADHVT
jgi:hypothetical protein